MTKKYCNSILKNITLNDLLHVFHYCFTNEKDKNYSLSFKDFSNKFIRDISLSDPNFIKHPILRAIFRIVLFLRYGKSVGKSYYRNNEYFLKSFEKYFTNSKNINSFVEYDIIDIDNLFQKTLLDLYKDQDLNKFIILGFSRNNLTSDLFKIKYGAIHYINPITNLEPDEIFENSVICPIIRARIIRSLHLLNLNNL